MYRSSGVALSLPSAALIFSLGTAVLEPAATFTADRIATHRTAWFCSPPFAAATFFSPHAFSEPTATFTADRMATHRAAGFCNASLFMEMPLFLLVLFFLRLLTENHSYAACRAVLPGFPYCRAPLRPGNQALGTLPPWEFLPRNPPVKSAPAAAAVPSSRSASLCALAVDDGVPRWPRRSPPQSYSPAWRQIDPLRSPAA